MGDGWDVYNVMYIEVGHKKYKTGGQWLHMAINMEQATARPGEKETSG